MAVVDVIIDITAIDLIAFWSKERLFIEGFKVLFRLKKVMINQQSSKKCAEVNQRKAEGFAR
jgi:hypothetical protein